MQRQTVAFGLVDRVDRVKAYQRGHYRNLLRYAAACFLLIGTITTSRSQSITWLGTLGGNRSEAKYVTVRSDGEVVVVGRSLTADGTPHAFRWTRTTGMESIGTVGSLTDALGASEDGNVVVGGNPFWRWTPNTGIQILLNQWGWATGVSSDGNVVVGTGHFYWTPQQGPQFLFNNGGWAWGVSSNGQVVGGWYYPDGTSQARAYRWLNGQRQDFPPPSGYNQSVGIGISPDGNYVLGYLIAQTEVPARFSNQGIEILNPNNGQVKSSSQDNRILVGVANNRAARWINGQYEDLNQTYANLLGGSTLLYAYSISKDGRYIVGWGNNAQTGRVEAYLLDTASAPSCEGDVNGDGRVDDADLLIVLFNFGCGS